MIHDYTRKRGIVHSEILLPSNAPPDFQDRGTLWNSVEQIEKACNSQLARELEVALPIELSREEQVRLVRAYCSSQFISRGMCADFNIHDTGSGNPHAHILLTMRPMDAHGKWRPKSEKEYVLDENGERIRLSSGRYKTRKVDLVDWNSQENAEVWRKVWADLANEFLERNNRPERIDHRSHAERGLLERPTVHEGVVARAMEKKGIISDRCELNRQIKADNALLRELKAAVRKLAQAVKNTLPVIAEAMEKLRANMIVFRYQLRHIGRGRQRMKDYIHAVQPNLVRYTELVQEIRGKGKERKSLLAQKKETPLYLIPKQCELSRHIAELTEELEELKSEKDMLLHSLECSDDAGIAAVKKDISTMEAALKKLSQQEEKYTAELNDALQQYADLKTQSAEFDPDELQDARLDLRPAMERSVVDRVQSAYGDKYDYLMMYDSKRDVADILHEETEARSIREHLRQKQQAQQKQNKKNSRDTWER